MDRDPVCRRSRPELWVGYGAADGDAVGSVLYRSRGRIYAESPGNADLQILRLTRVLGPVRSVHIPDHEAPTTPLFS